MRDSNGRFLKGYSGNPQGSHATHRRKTVLLKQLLNEVEPNWTKLVKNFTRKCIDASDPIYLKVLFEHVLPKKTDEIVEQEITKLNFNTTAKREKAQYIIATALREIDEINNED